MNINEYLSFYATWLKPGAGIEFKLRTPSLICADGFTMSVQASTLHYSKPAADHGPYTHVEVGYPSATVPELAIYRNGGVHAFVPVGVVDAIVAQHGGIAWVLDMEPNDDKRTLSEKMGIELRRYMARARQAERNLVLVTRRAEATEAKWTAIPWTSINWALMHVKITNPADIDYWITVADWLNNNEPQQEVQP